MAQKSSFNQKKKSSARGAILTIYSKLPRRTLIVRSPGPHVPLISMIENPRCTSHFLYACTKVHADVDREGTLLTKNTDFL